MALTNCKECDREVSNKATKCPHCGARLRKPRRGVFGTIVKWLFILFNVLMIAWLFAYYAQIGSSMEGESEAYRTGAGIGAMMGTGMLLTFWVLGDIILGIVVLFTRPRD